MENIGAAKVSEIGPGMDFRLWLRSSHFDENRPTLCPPGYVLGTPHRDRTPPKPVFTVVDHHIAIRRICELQLWRKYTLTKPGSSQGAVNLKVAAATLRILLTLNPSMASSRASPATAPSLLRSLYPAFACRKAQCPGERQRVCI